jgi:hypothetical protein
LAKNSIRYVFEGWLFSVPLIVAFPYAITGTFSTG